MRSWTYSPVTRTSYLGLGVIGYELYDEEQEKEAKVRVAHLRVLPLARAGVDPEEDQRNHPNANRGDHQENQGDHQSQEDQRDHRVGVSGDIAKRRSTRLWDFYTLSSLK